ncbi:hypothetical protein EVAR_22722_1 [Eumeta japonica]|uniref:Uncharacterized protein n=1 Tax=Eumeta variegata TaxID=151549 RepID=A0A4C1USY6_EUMVA|nr:hypothetical protein EVAR_22722_1 [Eumeta japonica]
MQHHGRARSLSKSTTAGEESFASGDRELDAAAAARWDNLVTVAGFERQSFCECERRIPGLSICRLCGPRGLLAKTNRNRKKMDKWDLNTIFHDRLGVVFKRVAVGHAAYRAHRPGACSVLTVLVATRSGIQVFLCDISLHKIELWASTRPTVDDDAGRITRPAECDVRDSDLETLTRV